MHPVFIDILCKCRLLLLFVQNTRVAYELKLHQQSEHLESACSELPILILFYRCRGDSSDCTNPPRDLPWVAETQAFVNHTNTIIDSDYIWWMRWINWREILNELQGELVPHYARFAATTFRFGGASVATYQLRTQHTLQ